MRCAIVVLLATTLSCVSAEGIPQRPSPSGSLEDALWRAQTNRWSARVFVANDRAVSGRVNRLASDSVTVGSERVALADVSKVQLRTDASPALLAGGAIGFLVGYGIAGGVAVVAGLPAGLATAGIVTVAGIALAGRAARSATEDDWRVVWER